MGTTAQKLQKLYETKGEIRQAIIDKDVEVPADATFASYSYYIAQISTGIEPTGNIELQQQTGTNVAQYATASVKSGAAGTPVATKGSVSGNQIIITPSVNNTASGWINSGTVTGATISVAASELVSGSITLTQATSTNVTNYASATVKSGSATTPATTIAQSSPTISVNSSGLVTASVASKSTTITPTVSAGWVASGTAGTVTLSTSSATLQLTTKAATTITPNSSAQTAVNANVYTTGAITVAAVGTETKNITTNGTYTPTSGKFFSSVTVAIPGATYRTGHGAPASSLGSNGDLYLDLG